MKTDDFGAWLEHRGITAKSINTRIHALTRLERHLEQLGAKQDSLDAAYDADRLRALLERLSSIRTDAKAGGNQFRVLMPDTTIAEQRLQSWQSWLRQYGQFREEQAGKLNRSEWPELEAMRDEFVLRAPDFSEFQQTSGSYWETEREYKDRMISAVQGIIASDIEDAEAGRRILPLCRKAAHCYDGRRAMQLRSSMATGSRSSSRTSGNWRGVISKQ